ncbi:MAG: hypothetical protein PWQ82_812 [Thermosediminibacterales bacterium]|nr:hypothetical protein [Thermosediminibacterales bacterium]MDK2835769.1 hypothetical protein [Thermosediminibacterales bacterium]
MDKIQQLEQQIQQVHQTINQINQMVNQMSRSEQNNITQLQQLQQAERNATQQLQALQQMCNTISQNLNQLSNVTRQIESQVMQVQQAKQQQQFAMPGGFQQQYTAPQYTAQYTSGVRTTTTPQQTFPTYGAGGSQYGQNNVETPKNVSPQFENPWATKWGTY